MTDASIDQLAGLKNLQKLRLGSAKITAAGREKIKTLLPQVELLK